jgi:AraC-like DNA-binding protein
VSAKRKGSRSGRRAPARPPRGAGKLGHEPTGLARIPLLSFARAEAVGISRADLLDAAGLSEHDLTDADARIPLSKIVAGWRALIARVEHPALGLRLGRGVRVRELGLVGYAMANSADVGGALERLARYFHIINESVRCQLVSEARAVRIEVPAHPVLDAMRHPVDARLAGVLAVCREISRAKIVPVQVELSYRRPDDLAEHHAAFGRTKFLFGRRQASLTLRASDLALPVVACDTTLVRYLDRAAEDVLRSLTHRDGSFARRVARALWPALSAGAPSVASTAALVGVSVRTLQRRLGEEGTTFAKVLERLRQELALSLLHDRRLAIYEVAFLLGYSEPSAFYRAFRGWRGISPGKYRAKMKR